MINISPDKKRSRMVLFYKTISVLWVLVLFLFMFITQANATTYYVAKIGNDSNPGTEVLPWLTVQKSANTLIAGDTVLIKTGIYNEQVIPQNSGSPGNYIVYIAYPGDTTTIDGTGISISWAGLIHIFKKSYIKISGLNIKNSMAFGIFMGNSNHIIIEKNYTYNTYNSGIAAVEPGPNDHIIIDNNEVELACNDGHQECITVSATDVFEIKNNHIHHSGPGTNGGEGIDAKVGCSNGKICNNYVHDIISRLGIYIDAYANYSHDIDVYQNVVHDCAAGFTVASENGGLLENVRVYNNIAYDNRNNGCEVAHWGPGSQHPIKDIKIINNTFYNNGSNTWGGGIFVDNSEAENVVIRNNICSENVFWQIAVRDTPQNLIVDHNLIDGFRGYPGEIYGSDSVVGDPIFVDSAGADFHLQESSYAIDAGSFLDAPSFDFDGNPRPQGAGYDIGSYEYMQEGVAEKYGSYIYPNPCRVYMGHNSITFNNLVSNDAIKIFDISGKLVHNSGNISNNAYKWNVGDISSGIYFYKITGSNKASGKIEIIR